MQIQWYVGIKHSPWFVVEYDYNPTHCGLFIPSPRFGDRKLTHSSLNDNHVQQHTMGYLIQMSFCAVETELKIVNLMISG